MLSLAGALGLLLLFLAVVPVRRLLAVVPIHRPAGIAGGVVARPIAIAVVVVLNSVLIGILIAQLGA